MAKKQAVPAVPVDESSKSDENFDDEDHEEMELLQVDVGDSIKVKQVLDETVANALLEHLEEDYRWDNMKLVVMTVACGFACLAQFAPLPFPESRLVLGICCCAYFALSGLLQLIVTFIDKDSILITKPKDKCLSNADMTEHGVRVNSTLPRFSEWYTVTLEFQGRENSPRVEQKWSVGQFFDVEGMFDEVGLMHAVDAVYKRIAAKKYDETKKDK